MQIAVIGAGYVGLITALAFAKVGHSVICVEKDAEKVDKLNKGIVTIYEEGLEELLTKCLAEKRIHFTGQLGNAIKCSAYIFIAVGTPSLEDGNVDLAQVSEVYQLLAGLIKRYTVIVNKSTVPVGTQKYAQNLLVKNGVSKKHFDIVSNPEFLREGKALYDFFHGDRIIIGCDSEKARRMMENLYEPFAMKKLFTTPETAELIKYVSNAFLATKISFINEIANLCNKVGVDVETVAYALGLDHRISPHYLKPGIGYGGSCLPKDTKALLKTGENYGSDLKLLKSAVEVNENQRLLPIHILHSQYSTIENQVVSILGLTFKPGTDDFREGPSMYIIEELLKKGAIVKCYDPMVSQKIKNIYPEIFYFEDVYETLVDSICAIICTEWEEFARLDFSLVKQMMKYPMIIDGRNLISSDTIKETGIRYHSIGKGCFVS